MNGTELFIQCSKNFHLGPLNHRLGARQVLYRLNLAKHLGEIKPLPHRFNKDFKVLYYLK